MNWNISSLLWFLGIGAIFYWMMKKGGCGMHGSHSHGSDQHGAQQHGEAQGGTISKAESGAARDPVCGMPVDPERAAGMRTVQGRNFFLCSPNCLEKFDKDPGRYATAASAAESDAQAHQRHAGCH